MRRFWLVCTIALGTATIGKALKLALTPDAYAALAGAWTRLLESSAFGLMLAGTAIVWLLSLCAAAWERSQRRWEEDQRAPCGEPMKDTTERGREAA